MQESSKASTSQKSGAVSGRSVPLAQFLVPVHGSEKKTTFSRRPDVIQNGDPLDDTNVDNKWKWSWLEKTDPLGDRLSTYIRKVRSPGVA